MAYGEKYRLSWTSRMNGNFDVQIYENGHVGGFTQLKAEEVELTLNYEGDDNPLLGKGLMVRFRNTGSFGDYDDLLNNYDRQFFAKARKGLTIFFEGYLVCDLNEQKILDNSYITLHFVNYIKRLQDNFIESFPIYENNIAIELIRKCINLTGHEYDYVVNSTLFEDSHDDTPPKTFLEQIMIPNDVFYKNPDEYDDAYTIINKTLRSFNCFMYEHKKKWVIERYDDIRRTGDWSEFDYSDDAIGDLIPSTYTNQKQELNMQTDFDYVDLSQTLTYNSGAQEIIVDVDHKPYDSLVYNDYHRVLLTVDPVGVPFITDKTWYINSAIYNNTLPNGNDGVEMGFNKYGINSYIRFYWDSGISSDVGLYYRFDVQLNQVGPYSEGENILKIGYKYASSFPSPDRDIEYYRARYRLIIRSGTYDGNNITFNSSGIPVVNATGDNINTVEFSDFGSIYPNAGVNENINLATLIKGSDFGGDEGDPVTLTGVVTFDLHFLPANAKYTDGVSLYPSFNYFGDFQIKIDPEVIDNQFTAYIDENFIKTKRVELQLADVSNLNYKTGLISLGTGGGRTDLWYDGGDSSDTDTLVNKYLKSKFLKLHKTTRELRATITNDNLLKPFCIITDNNIQDGGSNVEFILVSYTWDMVNSMADIVAEEYPDETIILT